MIAAVIGASAKHWRVVIVMAAAASIVALAILPRVLLDAIPDLSDTQVIVSAGWPGRGADLVDQQITAPLATALRSLPGVRYVRGLSMVGDAFIYVVFDDGVSKASARARVVEQLQGLRNRLPDGVFPVLGPDASSVGWVYEYALVDSSGRLSLTEMRALQDWTVRYWLQAVPGVAEIASVGGYVPQLEADLDPKLLAAFHMPLSVVADEVRKAIRNEVSGILEISGQEQIIAGRAQVHTIEDLAAIPLRAESSGAIVRLGELGKVRMGQEPRRGLAELNGRGEVVGGIVVMRQGQNALQVVEAVKRRISNVRGSLPRGVAIVPTYDRTELILSSLATLGRDLTVEMFIVGLVLVFFLGSLRSALIPVLCLPIASLLAFIPLALGRVSANAMSLGGIAIAIGAMADGAIIMVENAHKRLEIAGNPSNRDERDSIIVGGLREIGRPVLLAILVMAVSFLPLLGLQGVEGKMFKPLVLTKTYTLLFAALLAVTLAPALAGKLIPFRVRPEFGSSFARGIAGAYERLVRFTLARPRVVLLAAVILLGLTVPVALSIGREFMPALDEGAILYMPSGPAGLGGGMAAGILHRQDSILAVQPEVASVFGKAGRAATATDPAPLSMFETIVSLKVGHRFNDEAKRESLVDRFDGLVSAPGFSGLWWMPIQTRNEMLATGVRSPIGIKVFGPSSAGIESLSTAAANLVRGVRGVRSAYAERLQRSPALDFEVDRDGAARAGLGADDVRQVLNAAISGEPVGQAYQGRSRLNVILRLLLPDSSAISDLERMPVASPSGAIVELGQVAVARRRDAPSMLQEEDGELFGLVLLDVGGRPAVDVAAEAQEVVRRRLAIPSGYHLDWAGQYRDYLRARSRTLHLATFVLLAIAGLLYWNLRSAADMALVLVAVPFSLVGAIWLLALMHFQFSVAVWVGLLALAGLDAETGTIMLLYLRMAVSEQRAANGCASISQLNEAIVAGASKRLRPKLMTVSAILLGLLPILIESGPGSEVLKRVAAPMAGGIVSSFVMELVLYPSLYRLAHRCSATLPIG